MRSTAIRAGIISILGGVLVAAGTGSAGAATNGATLTEPQARAIVNAGVVMRQDLPTDYFSPPRSANEPDRKQEAAFYRCLGEQAPKYLARNVGGKYLWADGIGSPQAKTLEVDSRADVTDSTAAAVRNQATWRTPKAIGCYRDGLMKAMSRNLRGTPKAITVELVEASVAGADEAWAYQVSFTVRSQGRDVNGNGYVVGSRVGQALLTLFYTGSGKDWTLDEATTVAAKPVARAKQATPASKAAAPRS